MVIIFFSWFSFSIMKIILTFNYSKLTKNSCIEVFPPIWCFFMSPKIYHKIGSCQQIGFFQQIRWKPTDWLKKGPKCTRFVDFSWPKNLSTNRVLLTKRGATNRRMHCIWFSKRLILTSRHNKLNRISAELLKMTRHKIWRGYKFWPWNLR